MIFEKTIYFEPTSLKRHRHTGKGRTYDPSAKEKQDFLKMFDIPLKKMEKPLNCIFHFYCARPKSHYRTGKYSNELKPNAPKYNTCKKDIDNMAKFILDALNNKLYVDDAQVVKLYCEKNYTTDKSHIYMKFEEISDDNIENNNKIANNTSTSNTSNISQNYIILDSSSQDSTSQDSSSDL